jgi:hypothetical protein
LYNAYKDCRKRKRGALNTQKFEFESADNIYDLACEIQKGKYLPSRSVCFITHQPKLREIFAADFRDRIIHHLVVRELEKIYEPAFIFDSCASRPGKGIHFAVKRLQSFMMKTTKSCKIPGFYLQLDIRSFFMSIDKNILFNIIEKKLYNKKMENADALLYLLHKIIFHDCSKNFLFRGDNVNDLNKIPPHKSLFKIPENKGLPIGNLTSQFFANVYLNELDQFVKTNLKCRFYIRYVDDFVLLSQSEQHLLYFKEKIEFFLKEKLSLEIKNPIKTGRVSEGIDFLGYITRPKYILVRRRILNNLKYKLVLFENKLVKIKKIKNAAAFVYFSRPDLVKELKQTLSSYLGHFRHADSFNLVNSVFQKNDWLNKFLYLKNYRVFDKFKYKGNFRSLDLQFDFFRQRLEGFILFIKVGKYYELYNDDAFFAQKALGLKKINTKKNFENQSGFPVWRQKEIFNKIFMMKRNFAIIEQEETGKYVKNRYVKMFFEF